MSEDPYDVLQLPRTATNAEVNRAFYYVATMYHPDRGGNKQAYLRFQRAFKKIKAERKGSAKPKPIPVQQEEEEQYEFTPQDFYGADTNSRFNLAAFNDSFSKKHRRKQREAKATERTAKAYQKERMEVSNLARTVTPLYGHGQGSGGGVYDRNAFNRAFNDAQAEHRKRTGEVEEVPEEPQELTASGTLPYQTFDSAALMEHQVFDFNGPTVFETAPQRRMARNPDVPVSRAKLFQYQQQPDVTKVQALTPREHEERVREYKHRAPPVIHGVRPQDLR